jgi:cholesterol oxidase
MVRHIRRFSLEGVPDADVSVHPFVTEDELRLELTRFHRADSDDVVVLLHGLAASSDMFIMPEIRNMVGFLLDSGFGDVWTLDFRMSNRYPYDIGTLTYTLDDVAQYDHPAALRELRRHVGDRRIHVFAHCLGSVSFSMSLFGGAVDGIASYVSNSVSLTPRVPAWSRTKLRFGPFLASYLLNLPYLDPRFSEAPAFTARWLLARAVSLMHPECDVPACHMQSFMWGAGRPAFFQHENIAPETHVQGRMADLNGASDVHYYRHIRRMVDAGQVVKYDPDDPRHAELPEDFFARAADVTTPILFLTGDQNRIFTDSNVVCHERLETIVPGRHVLEILPGYGHIDPIMGRNAYVDVFPKVVAHFAKHSVSRESV